jgi:hypothetical protein
MRGWPYAVSSLDLQTRSPCLVRAQRGWPTASANRQICDRAAAGPCARAAIEGGRERPERQAGVNERFVKTNQSQRERRFWQNELNQSQGLSLARFGREVGSLASGYAARGHFVLPFGPRTASAALLMHRQLPCPCRGGQSLLGSQPPPHAPIPPPQGRAIAFGFSGAATSSNPSPEGGGWRPRP